MITILILFILSQPSDKQQNLFSPGGGHRHGPADGPAGHSGPPGRLVAARRCHLHRPGGPRRASLPGHVHTAADQRHASAGERRDVNDGLHATVVPEKIPDVTFYNRRPVRTRLRADCAVLLVQISKRLCSTSTSTSVFSASADLFFFFLINSELDFHNQMIKLDVSLLCHANQPRSRQVKDAVTVSPRLPAGLNPF